LKKTWDKIFTEDNKKDFSDIKNDATTSLARIFAVLVTVPFGWIVFISLHCFLWSTSYTFYQNLVITFDSLVIAVIIGLGMAYKVSGVTNIARHTRTLISKLIEKVKSYY
jgi:uncharacterized protein YqhQ